MNEEIDLLRKDPKITHTYEVYVFRSSAKGAPDKAMCRLFALCGDDDGPDYLII